MTPLAIHFNTAFLYARFAHHEARGPTFRQDHLWLAELYEVYNSTFDRIAERILGNGQPLAELALNRESARTAAGLSRDLKQNGFDVLLDLEKEALSIIRSLMEDQTSPPNDADQNLLQDIADETAARIYQIQQRLK